MGSRVAGLLVPGLAALVASAGPSVATPATVGVTVAPGQVAAGPGLPGEGVGVGLAGASVKALECKARDARLPVLLVHGYNDGPGTWSKKFYAYNPDVTNVCLATPFDYGQFSTYWVTHEKIGKALAANVLALSSASKAAGGTGNVVVVAHSMGGLAIRCAASSACGGDDRVAKVLRDVVTFGTPTLGTGIKAHGGWVMDHVVGPALSGAVCTPGVVVPNWGPMLKVLQDVCSFVRATATSEAARAFTPGSARLTSLPQLPPTVPVYAVAGSFEVTVSLFGQHRKLPNLGDLIVGRESAQAGAREVGGLGGIAPNVTLGPPRWHSTEPSDDAFIAAAVEEIRRAVKKDRPPPSNSDIARWQLAPGKFGPIQVGMTGTETTARGWTGRYVGNPGASCGNDWVDADLLTGHGIHLIFDGRSPQRVELIGAVWKRSDSPPPFATQEGIRVGSSTAQLRRTYGDRLSLVRITNSEQGPMTLYVLSDHVGALAFLVAGWNDPPEPGPTVQGMFATTNEVIKSRSIPFGC